MQDFCRAAIIFFDNAKNLKNIFGRAVQLAPHFVFRAFRLNRSCAGVLNISSFNSSDAEVLSFVDRNHFFNFSEILHLIVARKTNFDANFCLVRRKKITCCR